MPGIVARAHVAGVDRCIDVQASGATAAADSLGPAIPRALNATRTSIERIERQAHPDVDVLFRRLAVEHVDLAEPDVGGGGGNEHARHTLDVGGAHQSRRRIGRKLRTVHRLWWLAMPMSIAVLLRGSRRRRGKHCGSDQRRSCGKQSRPDHPVPLSTIER
jgi:hypothetical protein